MRWPWFVLAAIAAAMIGIAGWQAWEAEHLRDPKWLESDRPDCQVWDPYPQPNETATWSGECRSGKAEGQGTLTWRYTDPGENPLTETYSGGLLAGKFDGQATTIKPDGNRYDGMYRDGQKNGHGVFQWPAGRYDGAWKNNKQDGFGTYTDAVGTQHAGEWKQGCLDDNGEIIALGNDPKTCEKILAK